MNRVEQLKKEIETILPPERLTHTLGVCETAIELAKQYHEDIEDAAIAALLHDVAKYESKDVMKQMLIKHQMMSYLSHSEQIWHAPVGAIIAKERFGIVNQNILNAIRYHTTGRVGMSPLERIIFLADYIEPARQQPGVERIRELAKTSLDMAVAQTLLDTMAYLSKTQANRVHPDTVTACVFYSTNRPKQAL